MVKFYKVGGCVRDGILRRKCNDIDYSVEADSYDDMRQSIVALGGRIFLEKPEFFTIRAKVPNMGVCDYVLCRKDGNYADGRRPDSVEHGTILDDLARRDFTMNAMAMSEDGELIDPHCGRHDLKRRIIRCVGSAEKRFAEDSIRMLRAARFSITLSFSLDGEIEDRLKNYDACQRLKFVSTERIREEWHKAFKFDTIRTLRLLAKFPLLADVCFQQGIWLMPTMKQ